MKSRIESLDAYFWARWVQVRIKNLNHNELCSGEGVAALTLRRWGWGLLGRAAVSGGRAMIHQRLGRRVAAHLLRVAGGVMFNCGVRVHDLQRARIRWLSIDAILIIGFGLSQASQLLGIGWFFFFLIFWSNSDVGIVFLIHLEAILMLEVYIFLISISNSVVGSGLLSQCPWASFVESWL